MDKGLINRQKFKNFGLKRLLYMIMKILFRPGCEKNIRPKRIFRGIKSLYCDTIIRNKYSQYFYESDIQAISSYNLDFILRFSFLN